MIYAILILSSTVNSVVMQVYPFPTFQSQCVPTTVDLLDFFICKMKMIKNDF